MNGQGAARKAESAQKAQDKGSGRKRPTNPSDRYARVPVGILVCIFATVSKPVLLRLRQTSIELMFLERNVNCTNNSNTCLFFNIALLLSSSTYFALSITAKVLSPALLAVHHSDSRTAWCKRLRVESLTAAADTRENHGGPPMQTIIHSFMTISWVSI